MDEYTKIQNLIPNSTQTPNVIFDLILPRIPEAESRCLLYICRRTFGFHKEADRISFSQFIDGIKTKEGKILDYGAGLARASVAKGLKHLTLAGVISMKKTTKGNYYQINLQMDIEKVVQLVNQYSRHTKSGSATRPKVVQQVNTQKLGNKEKESISQSETASKKERSVHAQLVDYFHTIARQTRGVSVMITKADAKNLKRAIDLKLLKQEDFEKLILYFLGSQQFRGLSPSISTFLSSTVFNSLIDKMQNASTFWKDLDSLSQRFRHTPTEQSKELLKQMEQLRNQFCKNLSLNKNL
jgi:hypothetical protein